MACNIDCATFGKVHYSYDTTANILYISASACSGTTFNNGTCGLSSVRANPCGACTGCSYTTTNGSGVVSCWTDSGCTTPCGGADEFGTTKEGGFYQIGIWIGITCLALSVTFFIYKKNYAFTNRGVLNGL